MITRDERRHLLDAMSRMGSYGRAESENQDILQRTFWPVAEHLRAFDPDVVLVVGPRGSGKTELFKAVITLGLLPGIATRLPQLRFLSVESGRSDWRAAYPIGTGFPSYLQLREFVGSVSQSDELFLEVWLAYLIRVLGDDLCEPQLRPIRDPEGGDISAVLDAYRSLKAPALLALDRLDEALARERRSIYVAYDELDTLARGDSRTTLAAVRGLVGLWATHTRRWVGIRGKVFLRTDLYERAATAGGADFAKLAANRAELSWSDRDLYAMLVRRLANTDEKLREYCQAKIQFDETDRLGFFPTIKQANDARPLIERMVGQFMGADARKGLTFRWLLDHVRDGLGRALPRPLVRLIEAAAEAQKRGAELPRSPRLIEPRALRRALDKVSEEQLQAALDEWPWLVGLRDRLKSNAEVPWDRRVIEKHLSADWDQPWGDQSLGTGQVLPPASSGPQLVDYLVEVGVFRVRHDKLLDVPDLYLAGLKLKRKGGVRKK